MLMVLNGEVFVVVDHHKLFHRQAPQRKVMGTGQMAAQLVRRHRPNLG